MSNYDPYARIYQLQRAPRTYDEAFRTPSYATAVQRFRNEHHISLEPTFSFVFGFAVGILAVVLFVL